MKKWMNLLLIVGLSLFTIIMLNGCNTSPKDGTKNKKDKEVHIYVVRHGETMLNITDRVQGWSDAILTPEGERNIKKLGKGLNDVKFDKAYSSDSGRAMQTANIVLKNNRKSSNLKLVTDKNLREFNFGSYEGEFNKVMQADVAKSKNMSLEGYLEKGVDPREYANKVSELDKKRSEGEKNWEAENYKQIKTRVDKGMKKIGKKAEENGDNNILLVSHGLTIRTMIDMYSNDANSTVDIDNGSVTELIYKNGEYYLNKANDTNYLKKVND